MKITDTVRVGGINYDVKVLNKFDDGDQCDGHINWGPVEILLLDDDRHKGEYVEAVFIHEILHGILHHAQYKLPDGIDVEGLLDCFALGLHQVIKDNPAIFKD